MLGLLFLVALWLLPPFRWGLPIYRRPLPSLDGRTTRQLVDAMRRAGRLTLAFRQISDDEIGIRGNLLLGFSGVQALITRVNGTHLVARLGWAAVVVYLFFLALVWTFPNASVSANLMGTLIVVAVPGIDVAFMLGALSRLQQLSDA